MSNVVSINILPHYQQLLATRTSMQELLSTAKSVEFITDYDDLKRNYPWVKFIGLVGFDTKRQKFVLMDMETEQEKTVNETKLSEREQQVLQLVANGCTNLQIAKELTISENTVKTHLQNIFAKIKVQSRTEAAMLAVREGWLKDQLDQ